MPPCCPAEPEAAPPFEPSAALAYLDGLAEREDAAAAWDVAWIACLTGSPRWAEAARAELSRLDPAPWAGAAQAAPAGWVSRVGSGSGGG